MTEEKSFPLDSFAPEAFWSDTSLRPLPPLPLTASLSLPSLSFPFLSFTTPQTHTHFRSIRKIAQSGAWSTQELPVARLAACSDPGEKESSELSIVRPFSFSLNTG